MYSMAQLREGLADPSKITGHLEAQVWRAHSKLSRGLFGRTDPPITERDWDNLLILDACRFDLYDECADLPGSYEPYYSVASDTAEFLKRTFRGESFPDTVCVTATPKYVQAEVEESFHDIVHVWKDDWDEDDRTVRPSVMNDRVLEVHEQYPNKRLLAHYIPPHQPFVGETGKSIPHGTRFCGDTIEVDPEKPNVWRGLRRGEFEKETVWKAYRENLELALPAVRLMLEALPGRTVITSDHGNAFGEYGFYGHPILRHVACLIEVPWHVYDDRERKEIVAGDTTESGVTVDETVVADRLGDLGYV